MNNDRPNDHEKMLIEKLAKIEKLTLSLSSTKQYNSELEILKILEELVREQIQHENSHIAIG